MEWKHYTSCLGSLSCSIIDDGLIHKEELQLALFQTPYGENLFLDRVNALKLLFLVHLMFSLGRSVSFSIIIMIMLAHYKWLIEELNFLKIPL